MCIVCVPYVSLIWLWCDVVWHRIVRRICVSGMRKNKIVWRRYMGWINKCLTLKNYLVYSGINGILTLIGIIIVVDDDDDVLPLKPSQRSRVNARVRKREKVKQVSQKLGYTRIIVIITIASSRLGLCRCFLCLSVCASYTGFVLGVIIMLLVVKVKTLFVLAFHKSYEFRFFLKVPAFF